eukprot:5407068-Alexandrium_andersonii.AAC.1
MSTLHQPPRGTPRGCGGCPGDPGLQRHRARVQVRHEDRVTARRCRSVASPKAYATGELCRGEH